MLTVRNLTRPGADRAQGPLLRNITFRLDGGTCGVIAGPSGAGKTLLLRSLADLDPNDGEVELDGEARRLLPAALWRRRLCYVPAEPAWWTDPAGDHFADTEKALKMAKALGLERRHFESSVSRLSTGERQRLALIRACVLSPKVLLLDEPTAALDPDSVHLVEVMLRQFWQRGGSVLLVTHDRDQGRRLGQHFFTMRDGQLFATETAA